MADQFLEDWEQDEGKDVESLANCAERRAEWDAIHLLLVQAPVMAALLQDAVAKWGRAVRNDESIDGGNAVDWLSNFIMAVTPLADHAVPSPVELSTGKNHYHVSWEIDVWADSPREAAEKALATQQDSV